MRKPIAGVLALIVGLALPAFLLLADVEVVAYHLGAYRESFAGTGAPARIGLSEDQLVWTIRRSLDYATGRGNDLQFDRSELDQGPPGRPAFTGIELDHMVDVRVLFGLARTVRWAALGLAVAGAAAIVALERRRGWARLARGLMIGAVLFLGLWAVLAAAVLTGFSSFWTAFHETLFSNDLWLLPVGSLLIEMLPESLFQRLALEIVGLLTLEVLVVLLLAVVYLRRVAGAAGAPGPPRAGGRP